MQQLKGNYRSYRFPSLATIDARETGQPNPHQSGHDEGYKEGHDKGFEQGLAEGHHQGEKDGLEKGRQAGYSQGYDEGKALFDKAMESLRTVEKEVEELRTRSLAEYTDQICALVEKVARQALQAELTLSPHQVLKMAEDAIGRMDTAKGDLTVYLSDDDYKRLQDAGVNAVGDYPIKADNNLSIGDCRLESEEQQLTIKSDERIEKQVEKVREELTE